MDTSVETLPVGNSPYEAKAVYYEDSDSLEYVRIDAPTIYRRIDRYLTMVLSMDSREPVGFSLKGFRHFYLTVLQPKYGLEDRQFLKLITVLEDALSVAGESLFAEADRRSAYRQALDIAEQDDVKIDHFPKVA